MDNQLELISLNLEAPIMIEVTIDRDRPETMVNSITEVIDQKLVINAKKKGTLPENALKLFKGIKHREEIGLRLASNVKKKVIFQGNVLKPATKYRLNKESQSIALNAKKTVTLQSSVQKKL